MVFLDKIHMSDFRKRGGFVFRLLVFAIAVLAIIGVSACGNMQEQTGIPLEGKGTLKEPYLIRSVNDLEWLSLQVNDGTEFENVYFQQENDLDFSDYGNWVPIGAYGLGYYFRGIYDGHGHSIDNIMINGNELPGSDPARANVGLFGVLAGTVCNLKMGGAQ